MNRQQEKVLVATLCGLVVVSAATFAVQPAQAAGYSVEQVARVTHVAADDQLNVRRWPAAYSVKVGAFEPGSTVWVERCLETPSGSDWCLVGARETSGWVNARFLTLLEDR
jgi:uncharacterized protein YraI